MSSSKTFPDTPSSPGPKNLLGMHAAADHVRMSETAWRRMIRLTGGPPSLKVGKRQFFLRETLDQWLIDQQTPSVATTHTPSSYYPGKN